MLAAHPKVRECAVLALELADRRMTLKAFVVPEPGIPAGPALADELKAHAKSALLPHKYPRIVEFLDSLPKTGTGKIGRQALRARAGEVPSPKQCRARRGERPRQRPRTSV